MAKRDWYRLDNSAKIMPCTTTILNTNVFRLTCTLFDDIDKKALQEALDKLLPSFRRYYNVKTEDVAAPFVAEAVFQSHNEQYFLIKSARISEANSNEFAYFQIRPNRRNKPFGVSFRFQKETSLIRLFGIRQQEYLHREHLDRYQ